MIERFVEQNPVRFNRTDLREIASFKDGLLADFALVREGNDTILYQGSHAFCVRGIDVEIDEAFEDVYGAGTPCIITTTILPFDGILTHACTLEPIRRLSQAEADQIREQIARCREERKLARSARDFARMVGDAREGHLDLDDETLTAPRATLGGTLRIHEGKLAGLSWDERQARVAAFKAQEARNEAIQTLESWCHPGHPTDSIFDAYLALPRERLLIGLHELGIDNVSHRTSKRKLVETLFEKGHFKPLNFLNSVREHGERGLRDVMRVLDAGGRIEIAKGDVQELSDCVWPCFPVTILYDEGDRFVVCMPREAKEALAHVDWDAELESAQRTDEICQKLRTLVGLAGIVELQDVLAEVRSEHTDIDEDYLINLIDARSGSLSLGFDVLYRDRTSQQLISFIVADEIAPEGATRTDLTYLNLIHAKRGDLKPRAFGSLPAGLDAAQWMERYDTFRALTAWLDAHVPDGEDDVAFVQDASYEYLNCMQMMQELTPEAIRRLHMPLVDLGLNLTQELWDEFDELARAMADDVPLYATAGWSARELREGVAQDTTSPAS